MRLLRILPRWPGISNAFVASLKTEKTELDFTRSQFDDKNISVLSVHQQSDICFHEKEK